MSYLPTEENVPTEEELRELTHPESRGLYYVMPAEIMDSSELKPLEKMLYILLSGLAHKNSSCYPSDKYLAERLDVSESYVGRMVKRLETVGLIDKKAIPHPKWPFRKSRLITVHTTFKKCLRTGLQCGTGLTPQSGVVSKVITVSEETTTAPAVSEDANASVVVFFQKHKFSKKLQKNLMKHGEEKILKAIFYYQEHEEEILNPVGWFKSCLENDWDMSQKVSKTPQDRVKELKVWLCTGEHKEDFRRALKKGRVREGHNYVEFVGVPNGYIPLEEPKAKAKLKEMMMKYFPLFD